MSVLAERCRPAGEPAGTSIASLGVSCRTDRSPFVAMLRGALDSTAAPALREYLLRLVGECSGRLVIDLSAVTGADPGGLTVLVGTGRRATFLGGQLLLAAPAAEFSDLLLATGLDRQFRVYPSVDAAISSTGPR